jgi:hypothetical protein
MVNKYAVAEIAFGKRKRPAKEGKGRDWQAFSSLFLL